MELCPLAPYQSCRNGWPALVSISMLSTLLHLSAKGSVIVSLHKYKIAVLLAGLLNLRATLLFFSAKCNVIVSTQIQNCSFIREPSNISLYTRFHALFNQSHEKYPFTWFLGLVLPSFSLIYTYFKKLLHNGSVSTCNSIVQGHHTRVVAKADLSSCLDTQLGTSGSIES